MSSELDQIKQRYERRKSLDRNLYPAFSAFQHFSKSERDFWFGYFLNRQFDDFSKLRMLEVGAGSGQNLHYFLNLGIPRTSVFANELLDDRAVFLRNVLPEGNVFVGDARGLTCKNMNLILQATVFSSILDTKFQAELAEHLWNLLAPGGMFLWYDMIFNNPWNPDIRGLPKAHIRSLFPKAKAIHFKRTTLVPQIGRRVGRLYNFVNFPLLRSHVVAAIIKD